MQMIRPIITLRKKRILIDVDTQRDLFVADGRACVRNHRRILANIRRVMAWARKYKIRIISTAQIRSPDRHLGSYCVAGTDGVHKIRYTLRSRHVIFEPSDSTDMPRELIRDYDQIILCKRTDDPFEEPRAERVLTDARASEFIVIGGLVETSVLYTVLGLLVRNKPVTVIIDAIGAREKTAADVALRKMQAKGAKLIDSKSLLGSSHLRLVNACTCDRCRCRQQEKTVN
ncbi:MAG TPA: isochorismatase family protein [Anaerohalosphaeraceae bacterium]|nr:cysteine hydrolase [Phycisphaerae bacterium]HOK96949.1 isochorismatase family protein [Anaerohalosphaeraceae bacterium]HOL31824.1 isochorismatase family protein [Anaerohalosphaeraceae bacterium]HOM77527.1 isochorismatase family protein [Anaerohalosphaeraceae bacterium]HPO70949.1 isochorismatase family protein [Anaerohalosphaeraceae bacterium]